MRRLRNRQGDCHLLIVGKVPDDHEERNCLFDRRDMMRGLSGRIVCVQVVSLKLQDVFNQHFPVLRGHPNEASVEAIRSFVVGDGVEP
ncbi:MAG: hypothetical protein LZF86_110733 [Nitrospira sp.]|nr:MAG: hypothetical protein LZF86_110733 [Nitrospira sp.]